MQDVADDINGAFYPIGRFLSYANNPEYGPQYFLKSIKSWQTANSGNPLIPSSLRFGLKAAGWGHNYFDNDETRHVIGAFLAAEELGPATAWQITVSNEYYGFVLHDLWPILTGQERNNWAMEDEDFTNNYMGISLWVQYNEGKKK